MAENLLRRRNYLEFPSFSRSKTLKLDTKKPNILIDEFIESKYNMIHAERKFYIGDPFQVTDITTETTWDIVDFMAPESYCSICSCAESTYEIPKELEEVVSNLQLIQNHWSIISEREDFNSAQKDIEDAFFYNFTNARGRQGMQELLRMLLNDTSHFRIHNIGGSSRCDPGAKTIKFRFWHEEDLTSDESPLSSDNNQDIFQDKLKLQAAKSDMVFESSERKEPFQESIVAEAKTFIPDLIVADQRMKWANLIVSVKSGKTLGLREMYQIKYKMLLNLSENRGTIHGLVICPTQARLLCAKMVNKEIRFGHKTYNFRQDFKGVFVSLCKDIYEGVKYIGTV